MRKSKNIRTYAFLLHDLLMKFSPIFHLSPTSTQKSAWYSATGFTQKRHTLYAYYSGFGRKFQVFFFTKFRVVTSKLFRKWCNCGVVSAI